MWKVNVILNPRDFSEPSAEAHQMACEIARQCQARIIFLHVTNKPVVSYIEKASELSSEALQQKLWETLRWPREFEAGLDIEHCVAEGEPVDQILHMAKTSGCDLIVLGTHGRSGLSRWFAGSLTEEIVAKAPCSVLVAKPTVAETRVASASNHEHDAEPSSQIES